MGNKYLWKSTIMDDIVSGIDFTIKTNTMKKKTYESPVVTVHHVYLEDSLFCTSSSKEETEETEIEVDNSEENNLQGSSNFRNDFMDGHTWE